MRPSPRRARPGLSRVLVRQARSGGLAAGGSASAVVPVQSVCRAPGGPVCPPPPRVLRCVGSWGVVGWVPVVGAGGFGGGPRALFGARPAGRRVVVLTFAHGAPCCPRRRRRAAPYGGGRGGGGGLAFAGARGGGQWSVVSRSQVPRASACPVSSARAQPAAFPPVCLRRSWPPRLGAGGGAVQGWGA